MRAPRSQGRQTMIPLCSAGRTAYRGRKPPQICQPQHDRPRQGSDKPARAATIFIHNGAPQALVGCLDATTDGKIEAVRDAYKKRFHQDNLHVWVDSLSAPPSSWTGLTFSVNPDARSLLQLERTGRTMLEALLYRPIKAFLEGLGFVVKGEIGGCDLLALRDDDRHIVAISEFKLTFNLELISQGVDRAATCDEVWLAARLSSREKGRAGDVRFRNLCRRLGFGLLAVWSNSEVDVLASPTAPMPRKNPGRRSRLVEEHRRRRGDPVEGGGSRTPIMTAYRQHALACAAALAQGPRTSAGS
jgi:hypothetical protein